MLLKIFLNDTKSIDLGIQKKLMIILILIFNTNLDVKNNYDPYKSSFLN